VAEIICVGVAYMDHVCEVARLETGEAEIHAHDYFAIGSGAAANASVSVCRLAGSASFWGGLGDDETGRRIVEGLCLHGVQTDQTRLIAAAQSPVSAVLTDEHGRRTEAGFLGRNLESDADWLPIERIEDCNAVFVDPRWPEAANRVLLSAHEHRIPAILDGDAGPEPLPEAFALVASHILFSPASLGKFTGESDAKAGLERAAERTEAMVAVTSGTDSIRWIDDDSAHRTVVPLDAPLIDPLGARDLLHGAFTLAIGEGKDAGTAARFACVAAGLKSSRPGGRGAIPLRREIWEILDREDAA
jgi:sulfofructose kinase